MDPSRGRGRDAALAGVGDLPPMPVPGSRPRKAPAAPPVLPATVVDPEEAALVEMLAERVPAPPPVLANGSGRKAEREHAQRMVDGMKKLASDEARRIMARIYEGIGNEKLNKILKAAGGDTVFDAHKNIGHVMMAIMAQPEMLARLIEWGFTQPGTLAAIASKWAPKDPGIVLNDNRALILLPSMAASGEEWQNMAAQHGFALAAGDETITMEPITVEKMGGPDAG